MVSGLPPGPPSNAVSEVMGGHGLCAKDHGRLPADEGHDPLWGEYSRLVYIFTNCPQRCMFPSSPSCLRSHFSYISGTVPGT